jgi:succinate-semialdehyde dehydrogenase / glutarate-semialdehyde dehydrogenase
MSRKNGKPVVVETRQFTPRVDTALLAQLANLAGVAAARDPLAVEAPFTGETIGVVPLSTADDIAAAAARARAAQMEWARWSVARRAKVLLRFHDLVIERADEILDIIQLESGKARRHAFEEVLDTAIVARYYAHTAARLLRPRRRQGALPVLTKAWEYRHPKGLVGLIAPWNYPLTLGITDALPALVAGNGVIIKPDAQTPFSALWAVGLLEEAGLPIGLAHVVTGRGASLGQPLIDAVDFLMFTGSTATGRTVAQQAAARLIDFSAELGGKNAMLVLDDANLARAVPGALRAVYSNGGQLCIHAERLYVQAGIYDEFVLRFAEAVRGLRLGSGFSFEDDMGSIISAEQLAKIVEHVDDAVGKGAEVLAGGKARPDLGPYFYEPTVLTGATPEMKLYAEETFGPVVCIYAFETVDEAVERADDTSYGLNASVWTRDTAKGRAIAARLHAGTVNVNEGYSATWASASPMGGFKESGVGRRHGEQGLTKYTEAQTVAVQRLLGIDAPPGVSQAQYAAVMKLAIKALRYIPWID